QLVQSSAPSLSKDSRLRKNVVTSLIQHLQNVTMEFKANQTTYLNRLRNRQDNCEKFFVQFETPIAGGSRVSSATTALPSFFNDDRASFNDNFTTPIAAENGQISMKQLQILEENVSMTREREREIFNITKSIMEINHLFKDLASFIVDQGTVLDRIDYNIEQSNVRVKSALKSVRKAEDYQKKSRKMWCIMTLAVIIIVLLILLIIVKA
uniref:t-SNARE coiled-coil homology domain-containing protein n=1 Tax=Romanomermis culicivorax TaxID=13658 RepID=A0A915I8C9_ROMCU